MCDQRTMRASAPSMVISPADVVPCPRRKTAWLLRTTEEQRTKKVRAGHERLATKNVNLARLPEHTRVCLCPFRPPLAHARCVKTCTLTSVSRTPPANLKGEWTPCPNRRHGCCSRAMCLERHATVMGMSLWLTSPRPCEGIPWCVGPPAACSRHLCSPQDKLQRDLIAWGEAAPKTTKGKFDFQDCYMSQFTNTGVTKVCQLWHAIGHRVRAGQTR